MVRHATVCFSLVFDLESQQVFCDQRITVSFHLLKNDKLLRVDNLCKSGPNQIVARLVSAVLWSFPFSMWHGC